MTVPSLPPPSLHRQHSRILFFLAVLLAVAGLMTGRPLDAEDLSPEVQDLSPRPDTRFVFQGKLEESGEPARRTYDFVFRLFDHQEGGQQVGASLSVRSLALLDGSFAVDLDFRSAA